jgi:sulfite reductase (NADPH) flavoprotein alpha-component
MIKTPLFGLDEATLQKLTAGLDAQQQIWLSGFLYGLAVQSAALPGLEAPVVPAALAAPAAASLPTETVPAPAPAPVVEKPRVTVLYGSQTGNSKNVAKKTVEQANARGFLATLQDMNDYAGASLKNEQYVLAVVSTYGEGEPPASAETLHQLLFSARAPKLPNLKFSVLSLGDRSYTLFCQTGIDFDQKLAELGGQRIAARVDCDTDFEEDADRWIAAALDAIAAETGLTGQAVAEPAVAAAVSTLQASANGHAAAHTATVVAPPPAETVFDRKNPFAAPILEKIQLNGRGSEKETWHLELSLEGSGLHYQPGDSLGIWAQNPPELVQTVLSATRLLASEKVNWQGDWLPLGDVLTSHTELSLLSKDTLEKIYHKVRAPKLGTLLTDPSALRQYIYGRDLADVLLEFGDLWSAESLVKVLRRLQPRLYSIASSLSAAPDEVHLTVGAVRYQQGTRQKRGTASSWLADTLSVGQTTPVFVEHNEYFKLPTDPSANVIMVGPGTGIAPFRAFMQERQATGAKGLNWLVFGNPHFTTDFLYQTEWQQALKKGLLTRLDVAFSRDQTEKVYVQHKLLKNSRDVYGWLESGAYFYVCGDKNRMAGDVEKALTQIVAKEGSLSDEKATEYIKNLKKSRRYLEDVY